MSPRPSRNPLGDWRGVVIICAVLLAGQAVSTWVVTRNQVTEDDLVEVLSDLKSRSRRGSRGRSRSEGGASSTSAQPPSGELAGGGQLAGEVAEQDDASDPWSLESNDAVQRWDTLMQQRVERLAEKNGVDPATVLPDAGLREQALASGDLRSEASQQLIAEYSSILRELASEGQ